MTPDRGPCPGAFSTALAPLKKLNTRCQPYQRLCVRGDERIAEILVHRNRRRARLTHTLLGRRNHRRQVWLKIPLWDLRHQHYCLLYHRLLPHVSRQARRRKPSVEISGSHRLCWRVQHLLHLRMGNIHQPAGRSIPHCCPLCRAQLPFRTGRRMVRRAGSQSTLIVGGKYDVTRRKGTESFYLPE